MNKLIASAMIAGGLASFAADAGAGAKTSGLVETVTLNVASITGALSTTRNSANNTEYIYCWTNGNGVGACAAKDAAGTSISCSFSSAGLLNAVRAINSDSYVSISINNGTCTAMSVYTGSHFSTKGH